MRWWYDTDTHIKKETCNTYLDVVTAEESQHPLQRRPQLRIGLACLGVVCVWCWVEA